MTGTPRNDTPLRKTHPHRHIAFVNRKMKLARFTSGLPHLAGDVFARTWDNLHTAFRGTSRSCAIPLV